MDLYGLFQAIYGFSILLVPFLAFGIQGAIVKYYPIFTQKGLSNQFLSFTLALTTISIGISTLLLSLIYYVFKDTLFKLFDNFAEVDKNLFTILCLSYILTYSTVFFYHAVVRYRIVIPDIINTVGLKFFLPSLILITYLGFSNESWFLSIILIYFSLVALALFIYINKLDSHTWTFNRNILDRKEYASFFNFMGFSLLNGLGATLALRLDINMIYAMISKEAVAIYAIIITISNVMEIPAKALNQIASPVISSSWANDQHDNIQDVYQKSSLFGLIGGIFLFLVIYFIWVDIIQLMPGKLKLELGSILMIFSLLSFARITDLVTGVNSIIISYSKDYKFHMYFLIMLGVVNVILNYIFLKRFGLVGAAAATAISYILFNVLKHFFVKIKFGFDLKFGSHLYVVFSAFISFIIVYFLPLAFQPIINMIIKSMVTTLIFGTLIYLFNPGGEIQHLAKEYVLKLKRR
jgi:O-antigen/teichoic acid export membrane protein